MLFGLFVAALIVVFKLIHSPQALTTVLGGSLLSLLVIAWQLRSMWRERVAVELLLVLLPELKPEAALRAVEAMYFSSLRKPHRASFGRTRPEGVP